MKSTDKFVLVLVASLALLLAGCGGGSSTTAPPVDPGPTAAEQAIMDAEAALTTAQAGMSSAMTDAEMRDAYRAIQSAANNLVMVLKANNGSLAAVEAATTTRENAKSMADNLAMKVADAEAAADKAMMAMASKLYMAIGDAPLAATDTTVTAIGTNGALTIGHISDHNSDGSTTTETEALTVNKMATVASLHGWEGSQQTVKATGDNAGTYTAQLYSNVGDPTPGDKFNALTNFDTTNGVLPSSELGTANSGRIASPQFVHTAGFKDLALPDPNPQGETIVNVQGSYYGVAGTYSCTPGSADSCRVTKESEGYSLSSDGTGASIWTFKPSDPEARVTATPDDVYAVYGWWLHEADDGTTSVSAITGYRHSATVTTEAASGVTALQGTATYNGGAAGKYTVRAGAVNDAGHFTADAELMANFDDDTITGTIDNFMGGDGMSRDWSVALKENSISNAGVIAPASGTIMTTWTMDGSAASDSGQWSGSLYKNNDGGVPSVGTGTFHSEYGNIGRMVGAFGVDLEN